MKAAACALALLLAWSSLACGGSDPKPEPAAAAPPYPPTAAEPATAPPASETPAGKVVRIGSEPEGVAFDSRTGLVAVGISKPPSLVLVDGEDGTVRRRVPLPGAPRHLQLARPGGPVLVPAEEADALVQVPLDGGEPIVTRVGDQPHDAAALGGRVYVGDEFGSTLSVVKDGALQRQVPVDVQPGGVVAVGNRIGVISVQAYTLELFDPATLQAGGSRSAGIGPTHAVADNDGRIYVTDTRGDAVIVYATRPRLRWVGRVVLPGSPYGIAVDARRGRVWVALAGRNRVVELSAADQPRRLREEPTVRQPNTLAVDPGTGRVFIASRAEGTLQLLDS